jgi:GT2 family glycosyltransferase
MPNVGRSLSPAASAVQGSAPPKARPASLPGSGVIDVSVCIANWNCCALLRACLQSLNSQLHGVQLETIVVDNGSTDGAADMVAREFPEVLLIRNDSNLGFAQASNQAAERARGRYLFFLNNDTIVPAGAVRRLLEFAEEHPEIGMLGPLLRDCHGWPQVSYRVHPTATTLLHRLSLFRWTGLLRQRYLRYRRRAFDPTTTRPVEILMGAALFMPQAVFFAAGRWDEHYQFGGEDLDLSFQVRRHMPIMYYPEVEIIHHGRMSTRQHIGHASTQIMIGLARYLRRTGCPGPVLAAYKLVVLLDTPVQLIEKYLQYLWRRLLGRKNKAQKSWLAFRGLWHFLTNGLGPFLRA